MFRAMPFNSSNCHPCVKRGMRREMVQLLGYCVLLSISTSTACKKTHWIQVPEGKMFYSTFQYDYCGNIGQIFKKLKSLNLTRVVLNVQEKMIEKL